MMQITRTGLALVLLPVLALMAGFGATCVGRSAMSARKPQLANNGGDSHQTPVNEGEQLLLLYFGSASCGWCLDDSFKSRVREIHDAVRIQAVDGGREFHSIGVALDSDPERGLELLQGTGPFEQVAAGAAWANEFALNLLDVGLPPVTSLPQVVVYVRWLELSGSSLSPVPIVTDRILLARKIGNDEIQAWARQGAPLPDGALSQVRAPRISHVAKRNPRGREK